MGYDISNMEPLETGDMLRGRLARIARRKQGPREDVEVLLSDYPGEL